jgi:signal peptidase I
MKLTMKRKILSGLVLLLVIIGSSYLLFKPYTLNGQGMNPNFTNSQINLSNKLSYMFSSPKRGDVVVFKIDGMMHFKRIIGLPNEKLKIEKGNVYINGDLLEEPYLNSQNSTFLLRTDRYNEGEEFTISEKEYFTLGDNRSNSKDSRNYGTVSVDKIITRLTNICILACNKK